MKAIILFYFSGSIYLGPDYAHLAYLGTANNKPEIIKDFSYASYLSISYEPITVWACIIKSPINRKANKLSMGFSKQDKVGVMNCMNKSLPNKTTGDAEKHLHCLWRAENEHCLMKAQEDRSLMTSFKDKSLPWLWLLNLHLFCNLVQCSKAWKGTMTKTRLFSTLNVPAFMLKPLVQLVYKADIIFNHFPHRITSFQAHSKCDPFTTGLWQILLCQGSGSILAQMGEACTVLHQFIKVFQLQKLNPSSNWGGRNSSALFLAILGPLFYNQFTVRSSSSVKIYRSI